MSGQDRAVGRGACAVLNGERVRGAGVRRMARGWGGHGWLGCGWAVGLHAAWLRHRRESSDTGLERDSQGSGGALGMSGSGVADTRQRAGASQAAQRATTGRHVQAPKEETKCPRVTLLDLKHARSARLRHGRGPRGGSASRPLGRPSPCACALGGEACEPALRGGTDATGARAGRLPGKDRAGHMAQPSALQHIGGVRT